MTSSDSPSTESLQPKQPSSVGVEKNNAKNNAEKMQEKPKEKQREEQQVMRNDAVLGMRKKYNEKKKRILFYISGGKNVFRASADHPTL